MLYFSQTTLVVLETGRCELAVDSQQEGTIVPIQLGQGLIPSPVGWGFFMRILF